MKKVTLIGDCIRRDYQPIVRDELVDVAAVWGPKETIKTTRDVLAHLDEWVLGPRLDLFHFNVASTRFAGSGPVIFRRCRCRSSVGTSRDFPTHSGEHRNGDHLGTYDTHISRAAGQDQHLRRLEADVVEYNASASEVAGRYGVSIVDLHRLIHEGGMERYMARNGLHFTPEGYAMLGRAVAQAIRRSCRLANIHPPRSRTRGRLVGHPPYRLLR